jgi:NADH-quinone oxidoreductase subunit K
MSGLVWGVSLLLFVCGLAALLIRRELIMMLLGLELMIGAVAAVLVYQAGIFADVEGLSAVLIVIAVAAAEAVVGLSLILRCSRSGHSADSSALEELRG